jgi:hypothetical protein
MTNELFGVGPLIFLAVFAAVAFVVGLLAGLLGFREGAGSAAWRGLEAALLALAGGWIARLFIGGLMAAADNSPGAGLALGWGLLLWPGAVDTILKIGGGGPVLTTPAMLMAIASGVGAFTGMMDGLWRTHRWRGPGVLTFLADVTWGLAGSTNGCLFHLFNFAWASHANEPRRGSHRYRSGFRFMSGYAVTQGAVMSNLDDCGAATNLLQHEETHILQNRIFGPLFTLTYLGWMGLLLIPAFITGLAVRTLGLFTTLQWWCYYDNPWEVWAYQIGGHRSDSNGLLCWNLPIAAILGGVFFLGALAVHILIVAGIWF